MTYQPCGRKKTRKRGEEETWRQESSGGTYPSTTNFDDELKRWQRQASSSTSENHRYQKPDICYPEFNKNELGGIFGKDDVDESYFSSSPLLFEQRRSPLYATRSEPNLTELLNMNNARTPSSATTSRPELEEFFGEKFPGMEETFRSVLLQYFTQVDKEKQCLSDDLKKIKDDFYRYEQEGKKFKCDSVQKGKVIRKLTENGKLFVKEIERLRNELNEVQLVRRHLLEENNEMQKKLNYEGDAIPRMEKELKVLADENNYLKLLSDDTEKLSKQENEIRKYSLQVEHQKKILKQQANNLNAQSNTIKRMTSSNDELSAKEMELKRMNSSREEELGEFKKQLTNVQRENKCLQESNNNMNMKFKQVTNEAGQMDAEMRRLNNNHEQLDKMLGIATRKNRELDEHCGEVEKKCIEKEAALKDIDAYVSEVSMKNDELAKELRRKGDTISIMNEENCELTKEMEGLKKNLKVLQINQDTLVYEDETRSKELEVLMTKCNELETKYWETSKKEQRQHNELSRCNVTIEAHQKAEEQYKERIRDLQDNLEQRKGAIRELQVISDQRVSQVRLEDDKYSSERNEMHHELTIAQANANELRKQSEISVQERAEMYKELLAAQKHIFFIEEEIKVRDKGIEIMNEKYDQLQHTYMSCEEQKSELEKCIASVQGDGFNRKAITNGDESVTTHMIEYQDSDMQKKLEKLEEELNASENNICTYKDIINTMKDSYKRDMDQFEDEKHNYEDIIMSLKSDYVRNIGELQDQSEMCRHQRDVMHSELQILSKKYSETEIHMKVLGTKDRRFDKEKFIKRLLTDGDRNDERGNNGINTSEISLKDFEDLQRRYDSCEQQRNQLQKEVIRLQQQCNNAGMVTANYEEVVRQYEECNLELDTLREEVSQSRNQITEQEKERRNNEISFKNLQARYDCCKEERDTLVTEVERVKEVNNVEQPTKNKKIYVPLLVSENGGQLTEYDGGEYIDELHHLYETCEVQRDRFENEVVVLKQELSSAEGKVTNTSEQLEMFNEKLLTLKDKLKRRDFELSEYEKEKHDNEKAYVSLHHQYERCEEERIKLTEDLGLLRENYHCATVTIQDQEKLLDELLLGKNQMDEQKNKPVVSSKEDTAGEIEELHKMYNSCERDRNQLQKEVLMLKKQNGTLERKATLCDETKRQLEERSAKLNTLREELINKETRAIENNKGKSEGERVINQLRDEVKSLREDKDKFSDEMQLVVEKYEVATNTIENQEELMDKLLVVGNQLREAEALKIDGETLKKYELCEDQRNRLQKELIILTDKLKSAELKVGTFENSNQELSNEMNYLREELLQVTDKLNKLQQKGTDKVNGFKEDRGRLRGKAREVHELNCNDFSHELDTSNDLSMEELEKLNDDKSPQTSTQEDMLCYIEGLHRKYETCENQRNRLQKEILSIKENSSLYESKATKYDQLQKQLEATKLELNATKQELHDYRIRTSQTEEETKEIEKKYIEVRRLYDVTKGERNKLSAEIQACTEKHVNALMAQSDKENDSSDGSKQHSFTKLSKSPKQNGGTDGDTLSYIEDLEVQYDLVESHKSNLQNDVLSLKEHNKTLEAQYVEMKKELHTCSSELETYKEYFQNSENQMAETDKIFEEFQRKHNNCEHERMSRLNLLDEVEALKRKQCIAKAVVDDQENVIQKYEVELNAVKDVLSVIEKPLEMDEKGDIGFEFANKEDFDALIASYYACDNQRLNLLNELLNLKKNYHDAERKLMQFDSLRKELKESQKETAMTKEELEKAVHLIDSYQNTSESTAPDSHCSNGGKESDAGKIVNGLANGDGYDYYGKAVIGRRPYEKPLSNDLNYRLQDTIESSNLDLIKSNSVPQTHHLTELNENNSNHESGFEEVSLKHLESIVGEKDSEINELSGENRLLQEDLEVILSEYNLLQETYENVRQKLRQREADVKECEEYCDDLEKLVKEKTRIINELSKLSKHKEDGFCRRENGTHDAVNVHNRKERNQGLTEKDTCSDDYKELSEKGKGDEQTHIETSVVRSTYTNGTYAKNKAANTVCAKRGEIFLVDDSNASHFLCKAAANLSGTTFSIVQLQDTIFDLKETIKKKDETISDLRSELVHNENSKQTTHLQLVTQSGPLSTASDYEQLGTSSDLTTDTEGSKRNNRYQSHNDVVVIEQTLVYNQTHIIAPESWTSVEQKEKHTYLELLEASKRKQHLIEDLKSYIGKLRSQFSTKLGSTDEEAPYTPDEVSDITTFSLSAAALMSGKTADVMRNVLPQIPNGHYSEPRDRNNDLNGKYSDEVFIEGVNEVTLYNGEKFSNNTDDMRRNIMRLNSDLLRKSIEINRLEDELREAVRKTDKVKESYRDSVTKNETFEEEITINRKKIEEIQERHKGYELKENQYKRDIANLQLSLQQSKDTSKALEQENNLLKRDVDVNASTCQKMIDLENEAKHWKRNVVILEQEIQSLSANVDVLRDEVGHHKNELIATKKRLIYVEKERDAMKNDSGLQKRQVEDILAENEQLKFEIAEKMRFEQQMEEELHRAQQGIDHSNMKYNQSEINMKRMERKLTSSEEQNVSLQEQLAKLQETLKESQKSQMSYNAEREMAVRGTRYLEGRIDELQKTVEERDARLLKYTHQKTHAENKATKNEKELQVANVECGKLSTDLSERRDNSDHLEKLNDSMNNENKKLMHEISRLKLEMNSVSDDNEEQKEKLDMMEKEQVGLDNLVSKTQISNRELLDGNRAMSDELANARQKLKELSTNLKLTSKEKHDIEKSLIATNEELQQAYETLSLEKKDILKELSNSKKMINEFEAILEQGQVDFDEMNEQLEHLRHANDSLDKKLHKTSKDNVKLQAEREEISRRMLVISDEMSSLKTQMESQKRDHDHCSKEKESMEQKFLECKSREEFFEERLMGYEIMVHSKDDIISSEKKDKEKIQDSMLKLQSELIVSKTQMQVLLTDKDDRNHELNTKIKSIENLQATKIDLLSSKTDMTSQLGELENQMIECEERYSICKRQRDDMENEYNKAIHNLQKLESELENEKLQRHNDKEFLLAEVSQLKRNYNDSELVKEKHVYQQKSSDVTLKDAMNTSRKLAEKVKELENDKIEAKEKLIESVRQWQHKLQVIEEEKSIELIEIKASLEAIEEARSQDISLLKIKLEETEELTRKQGDSSATIAKKNADIESLKEDIIRLQTSLNKSDIDNNESRRHHEQLKIHIDYLETHKVEVEMEKKKLVDELRCSQESLKALEEQKLGEYYGKQSLLSEKATLRESYDKAIKIKDSEQQQFDSEIKSLKTKLTALEVVTDENESLKTDLDAILDERKALISENTQLRSENYDLRQSIEKIQDMMNENRLLKQQMRAAEIRHNETMERVSRENVRLRRNVDDLMKSNQDLELRNVGYIRARPLNREVGNINLSAKVKSASVDMLDNVGLDIENFVSVRNISTSLSNKVPPTQSMEVNSQSEQLINELHTDDIHKVDASWHKSQEEKRPILSIKSNPFLKNDKILKSTVNMIGAKSKSAPLITAKKPVNNLVQSPNEVVMYDMRPQSADTSLRDDNEEDFVMASKKAISDNLGHHYVNRLRDTFEKKQ